MPSHKHRTKRIVSHEAKISPQSPRAPFDWFAWCIAGVGGLAGALAFVPAGLWWLAPIAPLFLFETLRRAPTPGAAFRRVLFGGWVLYFGAIQWLMTIREYAPVQILAIGGIVLLALYMSLWIALPLWAVRRWMWPQSAGIQLCVYGSVWIISEWIRTLGRLANPLGLIGHAWAGQAWAIQIASWLGELGVSLEILLIAGVIVYWLHSIRQNRKGPIRFACAWTLLLIGILASGHYQETRWRRISEESVAPQKPQLHVAIIQPNINQWLKLASYSYPDEKVRVALCNDIATSNTKLVMGNREHEWQFVLMPETAYTEPDFYSNDAAKRVPEQLAKTAQVDILFGADRNMEPLGKKGIYNSAYLARMDGTLDTTIYDKMRLVPFGEALPYFDMIPGFQDSVVGIASFNEGVTPVLFETHGMKFGVLICFESTFSQMGRMFARRGADFLAVITNDAWYGMSAGPRAHFNLSLLRAVETRRWILRAANTGISAVITPAGTIQQEIGLGRTGVIGASIPRTGNDRVTFFMRFGNAWLIGACVLMLVIALWRRRGA
ncbi:apolipoprotein N-acyltransferase [bacterium]|nr:apolipoprotein N-acyltransferase [bacterium]